MTTQIRIKKQALQTLNSMILKTLLTSKTNTHKSPLIWIVIALSSTSVALLLILYIYLQRKKKDQETLKRQEELLFQITEKVRLVLKEIEIEASLTLNVCYQKYRDKQLQNRETKRQQLTNEFIGSVVKHFLGKQQITFSEMTNVFANNAEMKTKYDKIIG